jgi:hypothetical protein
MRTTYRWALALLVLATAGCTGAAAGNTAAGNTAPDNTAAGNAAATEPPAAGAGGIRLPLDSYLASAADVADLGTGYRALVRTCMAGYGYAFPPAEVSAPAPPGRNDLRYGLADLAAAAARGYRHAPAPARPPQPDLPAPALAALNGDTGQSVVAGRPVPAGGCTGQANRAIAAHDPPGADLTLPEQLAQESYLASRDDPRVTSAVGRWAACMRAAGYRYATPFDPPGDPAFRGAPNAAEISTATADVGCKRRTGLIGAWAAVEAEYQRGLIERNRAALERAALALRAELATAHAAAHAVPGA